MSFKVKTLKFYLYINIAKVKLAKSASSSIKTWRCFNTRTVAIKKGTTCTPKTATSPWDKYQCHGCEP